MKSEQRIDRRPFEAAILRKRVGGIERIARSSEGGIERRVRLGHRARRCMDQLIADGEVLEEVAGIGFEGHCAASRAAMASATATMRLAWARCKSSVILPLTLRTPLPALA